ncbi:pyridoxamine 5'-phosphate oxidase family protein [Ruminococcus flavefaciens]|uniref:pyridoxamine 5'-phosphate oxidase family protein n=1 Tax=Ruminococcus flavefaciens TaxID=1265 RepID=UPI000466BD0B|nr:pyridoxamine 5'-phosphate oxidase family protein [Ruminococcus flavefaciens]
MTKDEIKALIDRSLFASLGYTDENGRQNIRRVFCVWHKGLGKHLISTNTSSSHVQSLLKNGSACLYFADDTTFEAVCLCGKANISFDRKYKELLWNEGDEKYYSKGIDDEDYCIIEFIAESGRYYRFDGKADITAHDISTFDEKCVLENGFSKTHS